MRRKLFGNVTVFLKSISKSKKYYVIGYGIGSGRQELIVCVMRIDVL